MRKVIGYAGIALFVCTFVAMLPAIFIRHWDPVTRTLTDGWGREYVPTPFWARMFVGEMWPGPGWWALEMIAFFGSVAMASMIFAKKD